MKRPTVEQALSDALRIRSTNAGPEAIDEADEMLAWALQGQRIELVKVRRAGNQTPEGTEG